MLISDIMEQLVLHGTHFHICSKQGLQTLKRQQSAVQEAVPNKQMKLQKNFSTEVKYS